jgi:hypothetical protein
MVKKILGFSEINEKDILEKFNKSLLSISNNYSEINIISTSTKLNILIILTVLNKKKWSITKAAIHKILLLGGVKIAYKNVIENLNQFEKLNIISYTRKPGYNADFINVNSEKLTDLLNKLSKVIDMLKQLFS